MSKELTTEQELMQATQYGLYMPILFVKDTILAA